jgi:hypothetical protein
MAKRNRVAYNIQDVFFGQPKSAPFLPTDISNCIAWWDVDDNKNSDFNAVKAEGITAAKILSNIDGSTATLDSQASTETRVEKAINNKAAILLNGTDSWLASDIGYHVGKLDSEHSIFVVAEPQWAADASPNPTDAGLILAHPSSWSDMTARGITQHNTPGSVFAYYGAGPNYRRQNWPSDPNYKPHIYVHRYDGGTSHSGTSLKIDGGAFRDSQATAGTPTNIASCGYLSVGRGTDYWKGYVAEIIIYDRVLDHSETTSVEKYLSEKWGVSLSDSDQQVESMEILNRINRIQNFDYNFNVTRTSEGVLGKSMEVDRPVIEPPSVDITLSYFLDGGNNENRMGFDIAHQEKTEGSIGKVGESNYKPPLITNNFYDTGRYKDARNIYLVTNNGTENDIREQRSGYPMFVTGTSQIPKITDPNAGDYGVMAFQNAYVTSYTVDFSIESLPRAEVALTADNVTFFASGTGIDIPRFNTEKGLVEYNGKKMIIPKHFEESEVSVTNRLPAFQPGDISLKIWNEDTEDIYESDFSSDVDGWTGGNLSQKYNLTSTPASVSEPGLYARADTSVNYHKVYKDAGTVAGKKYKITAKIYIPSDSSNTIRGFQFRYANGTSSPIIHPTLNTWYDFSYEYTAVDNGAYDGWIEFWMANSSSVDTSSTFAWAGGGTVSTYDQLYVADIVVTEISDSVNFHNDTIQSCNITVNCNRENIAYMGHKYYSDKPIKTPMTVDTTIGMIVNENLTGDFSRDIQQDRNYNVDILCKISGETKMKYTFSGSRFDSVNYSSSIGSNKTSNLQFSTAMDHDNFTKGLFVSGTLMEIQQEITAATSGSEDADSDTDTIYEKGTGVGLPDDVTDHDLLYGANPLY